jgi:hypothetical protein
MTVDHGSQAATVIIAVLVLITGITLVLATTIETIGIVVDMTPEIVDIVTTEMIMVDTKASRPIDNIMVHIMTRDVHLMDPGRHQIMVQAVVLIIGPSSRSLLRRKTINHWQQMPFKQFECTYFAFKNY